MVICRHPGGLYRSQKCCYAQGGFSKVLPPYIHDESLFDENVKSAHLEKMKRYKSLVEASIAGGLSLCDFDLFIFMRKVQL